MEEILLFAAEHARHTFEHQLNKPDDRGQRRAQLVRYDTEKLGFAALRRIEGADILQNDDGAGGAAFGQHLEALRADHQARGFAL